MKSTLFFQQYPSHCLQNTSEILLGYRCETHSNERLGNIQLTHQYLIQHIKRVAIWYLAIWKPKTAAALSLQLLLLPLLPDTRLYHGEVLQRHLWLTLWLPWLPPIPETSSSSPTILTFCVGFMHVFLRCLLFCIGNSRLFTCGWISEPGIKDESLLIA